jgi:hypothetical protein
VGHGEPWGGLGWGGKRAESEFPQWWQSGLAMAAMFQCAGGRRGSMRGSRSFLEVLWSCLSDRRGVGAAGRRGLMGGDDGTGLVR